MRFIKTFLPFGFMLVLLVMLITHYADPGYFLICLLGLQGWLEYVELSHKISKSEAQ